MATNKKVMHFINGEKQAQRLVSFSFDQDNHSGLTETRGLLLYRDARMGQDAAGALHGMGCRILEQDIEIATGMFKLTILMPTRMTAVNDDSCDACEGMGNVNGEQCWHCEGEGIDPTK